MHRAAGDVALVGDALENVHQLVQASAESAGQSTGPTEAASETGTVSYKGASHPVSAGEAAELLVWLDEREFTGPELRAAACLRRVAGCVPHVTTGWWLCGRGGPHACCGGLAYPHLTQQIGVRIN